MWRSRFLLVLLAGTAITSAGAQDIVLEEIVVAGAVDDGAVGGADTQEGTAAPSETASGARPG